MCRKQVPTLKQVCKQGKILPALICTQTEKSHLPLPAETLDSKTPKLRGIKIHVSETMLEEISSAQPLQSHLKTTHGSPSAALFPNGAACVCKAWGSKVFLNHTNAICAEKNGSKDH